MSIVFYGFRIKKSDFWPTVMKVRDFYALNFSSGLKNIEEEAQKAAAYPEYMTQLREKMWDKEIAKTLHKYFGCRLQIFDPGDDSYYLRVLEQGWLFQNSFEGQQWPLEGYNVDTRSDSDDGEEERCKYVMDVLNPMIESGRYLLFDVLTESDIDRIRFTWHSDCARRVREITSAMEAE